MAARTGTEVAATVDVRDVAGKKVGTVDLPAEWFGGEVNIPVMHQVVTAQLAAARQGTHRTRTRAEVRGGGRKPWKQKGTGRARQGSTRSPQWVGGGVAHGSEPRPTLVMGTSRGRVAGCFWRQHGHRPDCADGHGGSRC